jgi:phage recombination protein Bet
MNQVQTVAPVPRGVIATLAAKYNMDSIAFERTLRNTVFPAEGTKEQFAAFCMVATRYGLDPMLKQIHAFVDKKAAIVPIVSIDGWIKLMQDHDDYDGLEFEDKLDVDGMIVSIRCRIYRKAKAHPTEVVEYLSECKRDTPAWRSHPNRMLRHRAMIQCIRYAYGISGIVDEEEYAHIIEAQTEEQRAPAPKGQTFTQSLREKLRQRPVEEAPPVAQDWELQAVTFRELIDNAQTVEDIQNGLVTLSEAKHPDYSVLEKLAMDRIGQMNQGG